MFIAGIMNMYVLVSIFDKKKSKLSSKLRNYLFGNSFAWVNMVLYFDTMQKC